MFLEAIQYLLRREDALMKDLYRENVLSSMGALATEALLVESEIFPDPHEEILNLYLFVSKIYSHISPLLLYLLRIISSDKINLNCCILYLF
jgi:hypothetical protein